MMLNPPTRIISTQANIAHPTQPVGSLRCAIPRSFLATRLDQPSRPRESDGRVRPGHHARWVNHPADSPTLGDDWVCPARNTRSVSDPRCIQGRGLQRSASSTLPGAGPPQAARRLDRAPAPALPIVALAGWWVWVVIAIAVAAIAILLVNRRRLRTQAARGW